MFTDHKFCARWPPFSQEASIRNLPMMPFVRYPQRQSPLLTPPTNFILAVEIRAQATRMARPEVFASAIRNDVASAGSHTVDLLRLTSKISSAISLVTKVRAG